MSREVIASEDVVAGLCRGNGLTFTLQDKIVSGKLDLKHHTVDIAVEVRDCEFQDDVDLKYCEFSQVVDLSGCTFHGHFNSGDSTESHTVYRKDLICNTVPGY